jgi:hypothetical protein
MRVFALALRASRIDAEAGSGIPGRNALSVMRSGARARNRELEVRASGDCARRRRESGPRSAGRNRDEHKAESSFSSPESTQGHWAMLPVSISGSWGISGRWSKLSESVGRSTPRRHNDGDPHGGSIWEEGSLNQQQRAARQVSSQITKTT